MMTDSLTDAREQCVAPVHTWLRSLRLAFMPGFDTPMLQQVQTGLRTALRAAGHDIQSQPDEQTDVLFTAAQLGRPVNWREAPFFQARRLFGLRHQPTVFTVVHATPAELSALLTRFERALAKQSPDPQDFVFPGLAPTAYRTLMEQGRRGGPILALERMVQGQAMCLRILLVVGEAEPEYAYHFDLVGSYARSGGGACFYSDIALRVATAASAQELAGHEVLPDRISFQTWSSLATPAEMRRASAELDRRHFFTEMVRIPDLVQVPALSGAIASQYSEGCFATWEPGLDALVATITGSARPVDKGNIADDDLAVICGLSADGLAVAVRHVEGKRNDPPSSEAFEMVDMDRLLPRIRLDPQWGIAQPVPVIRSKLHGHRGVVSYDPDQVEFVPMDEPYSAYPVTCGTVAQASGLVGAFTRSQALHDASDPRAVVFTLLPTHGVFVVEKWVAGKAPFEAIWEAMDAGYLEVVSRVPQGPSVYEPLRAKRTAVLR